MGVDESHLDIGYQGFHISEPLFHLPLLVCVASGRPPRPTFCVTCINVEGILKVSTEAREDPGEGTWKPQQELHNGTRCNVIEMCLQDSKATWC